MRVALRSAVVTVNGSEALRDKPVAGEIWRQEIGKLEQTKAKKHRPSHTALSTQTLWRFTAFQNNRHHHAGSRLRWVGQVSHKFPHSCARPHGVAYRKLAILMVTARTVLRLFETPAHSNLLLSPHDCSWLQFCSPLTEWRETRNEHRGGLAGCVVLWLIPTWRSCCSLSHNTN